MIASPDAADPRPGGLVCFPLQADPAETQLLTALLSDAERARAARFHNVEHANQFVVAHARLRQLLAAQLNIAPQRLEFTTAAHGKPGLGAEQGASGLQFNLSHSGSLGLVGWAWQRALGVDVESWRPMRDERALVHRFFSASEIAAYEELPQADRTEGFFNCWTRKEAYVKAVGRGLGLPLRSFDVSLGNGAAARLLRPSDTEDDPRAWSLVAPQLEGRISVAVVMAAASCRIETDP